MIDIIRASEHDAPRLTNLNESVHDMHLARHPERFKVTNTSETLSWFASMLCQPHVRAWIAVESGRPLGYVLTVDHDRAENAFQHARRFCEIDQLAVLAQERRRGIGRRLIEHAVREAKNRSIPDRELSVWAFNTSALAIYSALVFSVLSHRFGFAAGTREDQ